MNVQTREESELKRLLLDLISVDTTERTEEAAKIIKAFLEEREIEVKLQRVGSGEVNVLASLRGGKPSSPKIILSGHLDVVPPGDLSTWTECNPFEPRIDGDLIYGRGSTDMKGGVVAIIGALVELKKQQDFDRDILFLGTTGEERAMGGAKKFIEEYQPRDVEFYLIAEPTDLKLGVAEKGVLWLEISFKGRASHGSRPELGRNAIKMAVDAMKVIEKVLPPEEHTLLGKSTMNVGIIKGGTAINIVPDKCSIEIDFRLVPGIETSALLASVKDALETELGVDSFEIKINQEIPAIETLENHYAVQSFKNSAGSLLRSQEVIGLSYATDAAILSPFDNTPFFIFGPGKLKALHTSNENISWKDVLLASRCIFNALKKT